MISFSESFGSLMMKRYVLTFALLLASIIPAQAEDFWHDSVRACIVGGGVVGASSAFLLYSAAAAGTVTLPVSAIVAGNTIFGCGLGTIGTMLVYGAGSLYSSMTSSSEPAPTPTSEAFEHK
jgi:hypothetical protein